MNNKVFLPQLIQNPILPRASIIPAFGDSDFSPTSTFTAASPPNTKSPHVLLNPISPPLAPSPPPQDFLPQRSALQMDSSEVEGKPSEEISETAPQETREEMLSRHRKEISQLQNKEIALKKAAAKGSKVEQKAKKKQVEDEISQLSAKLKEKHAEELASAGYGGSNGKEKGDLDSLVKAIAGVSVTNRAERSKPSKSVQRREKRAQQEAAREQRIQEEQSDAVSDAVMESEATHKMVICHASNLHK